MLDPIKTIGQKLGAEAQRDAIHIAITPVTVGCRWLTAGRPVMLVPGTTDTVTDGPAADYGHAVGIIDPFLDEAVREGHRVWLFLYPHTVTGMRHEWRHPAFDEQQPTNNGSELWLRQFAVRHGFDYDELIRNATDPSYDDVIVAKGRDCHSFGDLGDDGPLFWEHLENLRGTRFNREHRESIIWSCSC